MMRSGIPALFNTVWIRNQQQFFTFQSSIIYIVGYSRLLNLILYHLNSYIKRIIFWVGWYNYISQFDVESLYCTTKVFLWISFYLVQPIIYSENILYDMSFSYNKTGQFLLMCSPWSQYTLISLNFKHSSRWDLLCTWKYGNLELWNSHLVPK